ncbi:MAG: TVP38/TMEM64 family protein [Leptolyngbya sp. SIO4C1]|nr:TVP38/TMEM64 family protein [Leptolyngbya sp. SIO4C1]
MFRKKAFWGFLLAAAILTACCWKPFLLLGNPTALQQYLDSIGSLKAIVFIGAHIIATAVGVPGTVLVIAGGAVFGLLWGTVWSVIGATLGAIAAFELSRHLLHSWFKRRFSRSTRFYQLNQLMRRQGLACVMAIRFAPISPFNLVNFLFGLTPVPLSHYAIGTLVGIIPGTLIYTWLGVAGVEALSGGSWLSLLLCLSLLALLSVLPILARRYYRK